MTKKTIDKYEAEKIERQKAVDCLTDIQLTQIIEYCWATKKKFGAVFVRDLHRLEGGK